MATRLTRRRLLSVGVGAAATLGGCLGGESGTSPTPTATPEASADGPPPADESAYLAHDPARLRDAVVSGGPPKDGIPAIDDPTFVAADAAGFLSDASVVFGVVRGETVRVYPQSILVHHEVVNDSLDGHPVSVTYCPLTGTVMGFDRGDTTFGVSGDLVNSNLVMYDRATDSRWPQILATAISGPLAGQSLREFDVAWTTWKRWLRLHPDTAVLSRDTGFVRNYDADPYGSYAPEPRGYYAKEYTLFDPLVADDRLEAKTVVVGVRTPTGAAAVERSTLRSRGVVELAVGDERVLVVYDPAVDTGYAYRAPPDTTVVREQGEVRVGGERYAPDALPAPRRHAIEAMWFAWAGFYPGSDLHVDD